MSSLTISRPDTTSNDIRCGETIRVRWGNSGDLADFWENSESMVLASRACAGGNKCYLVQNNNDASVFGVAFAVQGSTAPFCCTMALRLSEEVSLNRILTQFGF